MSAFKILRKIFYYLKLKTLYTSDAFFSTYLLYWVSLDDLFIVIYVQKHAYFPWTIRKTLVKLNIRGKIIFTFIYPCDFYIFSFLK